MSTDNPFRYDYERARTALGMLRPSGYSANALQLAGFLLAPLVAFGAGLTLALKDFRHRTIRLRAVRFRLGRLELAYSLTAGLVGVAAVIGAVVAAVCGGVVTSGPTTSALALDVFEPVPEAVGTSVVAVWAGFAGRGGLLLRRHRRLDRPAHPRVGRADGHVFRAERRAKRQPVAPGSARLARISRGRVVTPVQGSRRSPG